MSRQVDVAAVAPGPLLKVEEARALLAECKRVDEAKSIRDKAQAIAIYLRNQKASADAQNDAAEIKLRAERRLGELTAEQEKAKGVRAAGGGKNPGGHMVRPPGSAPTYAEQGFTKQQAARWQEVARVPEEKFEAHLATLRRSGERITTRTCALGARIRARFGDGCATLVRIGRRSDVAEYEARRHSAVEG